MKTVPQWCTSMRSIKYLIIWTHFCLKQKKKSLQTDGNIYYEWFTKIFWKLEWISKEILLKYSRLDHVGIWKRKKMFNHLVRFLRSGPHWELSRNPCIFLILNKQKTILFLKAVSVNFMFLFHLNCLFICSC